LAAVAGGVVGVVFTLAAADAPPAGEHLVLILATMLVVGASLALDDPGHSLVAAAPVGFARRLAHRRLIYRGRYSNPKARGNSP